MAETRWCAVSTDAVRSTANLSSGDRQSAVAFHHVACHRSATTHASYNTQLNVNDSTV